MYNKNAKCKDCIPEILPENRQIIEVYTLIQNQHIMGFNGPVDLNLLSLDFAMNIVGVKPKNKNDVFNKVYMLYQKTLKKLLLNRPINTSKGKSIK